jgi:hypothetical protein
MEIETHEGIQRPTNGVRSATRRNRVVGEILPTNVCGHRTACRSELRLQWRSASGVAVQLWDDDVSVTYSTEKDACRDLMT